ncbi:MAG: hypothetical protein HY909_07360 [Deltaproteobacteria bacterium]|nr:hypothetical protein [Deltaproteobacteria bacterium]
MATPRELRIFEYVNRPFEAVREAMKADPLGLLRRATAAGGQRARSLAVSLRVDVGAVEVAAEIDVSVGTIVEEPALPGVMAPATRLPLRWQAAHAPGLFPTMDAVLTLYPLGPEETQLDLQGKYRPPGGLLGNAVDALVGHTLAEASVKRFLEALAAQLGRELPG